MPRLKSPKRRAYDTDLSDGQWALIAPLIPEAEPGGRPRKAATRELVNAMLYFRAGGCSLALASPRSAALADGVLLPAPLAAGGRVGPGPPRAGDGGSGACRPAAFALRGHPGQPVGEDRRSKGGARGYDAGKRIWGRKRHILTDTDGRLLAVHVHGADIQDRDGAKGVLKRSRARYPFVEHAFADGGYAGRLVDWTRQKTLHHLADRAPQRVHEGL